MLWSAKKKWKQNHKARIYPLLVIYILGLMETVEWSRNILTIIIGAIGKLITHEDFKTAWMHNRVFKYPKTREWDKGYLPFASAEITSVHTYKIDIAFCSTSQRAQPNPHLHL